MEQEKSPHFGVVTITSELASMLMIDAKIKDVVRNAVVSAQQVDPDRQPDNDYVRSIIHAVNGAFEDQIKFAGRWDFDLYDLFITVLEDVGQTHEYSIGIDQPNATQVIKDLNAESVNNFYNDNRGMLATARIKNLIREIEQNSFADVLYTIDFENKMITLTIHEEKED